MLKDRHLSPSVFLCIDRYTHKREKKEEGQGSQEFRQTLVGLICLEGGRHVHAVYASDVAFTLLSNLLLLFFCVWDTIENQFAHSIAIVSMTPHNDILTWRRGRAGSYYLYDHVNCQVREQIAKSKIVINKSSKKNT